MATGQTIPNSIIDISGSADVTTVYTICCVQYPAIKKKYHVQVANRIYFIMLQNDNDIPINSKCHINV